MLSGFCLKRFGVLFRRLVLGCRYTVTTLLLDRVVSGACFLTVGVFECEIAYCRSVAVLFMLYKIRCKPTAPSAWCSNWTVRACAGYTRCSGCTSIFLYDSTLQNLTVSTTGPLFPSQCPFGTILLTLYYMVWDWLVFEAGSILFYLPKLLYPYVSLSLLSVYRLVLWGWGLWTDRVLISLSQPCTADLFQ